MAHVFETEGKNRWKRMKNLKTDKIYLFLTNVNNVDFSPSVPETLVRCTDEFISIVIYYSISGKAG